MDLRNPNAHRAGSIVKPEMLVKQIEEAKKTAPPVQHEEAQIVEDAPAAPGQVDSKKKEEDEKYQEFLKFKAENEEILGATITEEDVRALIFQGRLKKELVVVPGIFVGVFQTLIGSEIELMDQHIASYKAKAGFTPEGLQDERAKMLLSYAWLKSFEMMPDGSKRERPLGATPEARRKTIDALGAHIILEASRVWNQFELFIRVMMQEKKLVKKS